MLDNTISCLCYSLIVIKIIKQCDQLPMWSVFRLLSYYSYIAFCENVWNFHKYLQYFQKNVENLEHFRKCRTLWKVLKISEISENVEDKMLLEYDTNKVVSSSCLLCHGISPSTNVILHGCMNDIPQLCCIIYICWSHDWIWPIGLEVAQEVYNAQCDA